MGCSTYTSQQLGIAFGCAIAAGAATVVGALVIVLVRSTRNTLFLAAAMAFASGVMTYISLIDILGTKAVSHFRDSGANTGQAFAFANICFFCGMPIAWGLDLLGDWVMSREGASMLNGGRGAVSASQQPHPDPESSSSSMGSPVLSGIVVEVPPPPTTAALAAEEAGGGNAAAVGSADEQKAAAESELKSAARLLKVGVLAALAIGFHNAPEGLVTFVSYLDGVSSGVTTAAAIAIHNVPEGMAVAVPIYYATGSRVRAVGWASLSAFMEPLGAVIGLAVACGGSLTDQVFGILFGLVAGIMIYVAVKELGPTARHYDPTDRVSTLAFTGGMLVMALSLVAINFD